MNKLLAWIFSLATAILAGCASVFPQALREQARPVPFAALQQAPERYAGTLVLLGGEVLVLRPRGAWLEIDVLERPLGLRDRPRVDQPPRGTFTVLLRQEPGDAETDSLRSGRLVTVVGEVQGRSASSPGPPGPSVVLMARHLHLWPAPLLPGGPNIGIEFGYEGSIGF